MSELYDIPNGRLKYIPGFIEQAEADRVFKILHSGVPWESHSYNFGGKIVPMPRKTAWFGDPGKVYTYSGIKNDPKGWDYVSQNKKRVGGEIFQLKEMAEKLLNPAIQHKFNSVLLNLYQTGRSSVGWHSDNEPELGQNPVIASVSLGGERWFSLRHNITGQEVNILLEHGSCLLMGGELQKFWKHAILKDDRPMFSQPRINLTFRKII